MCFFVISDTELNKATVIEYLEERPDFLEEYVYENISMETLEQWMIRKMTLVKVSNELGRRFIFLFAGTNILRSTD